MNAICPKAIPFFWVETPAVLTLSKR